MKKQTFETAIKQLEDIVEKLEAGDVDLDNSVCLYEQGMQLKKFCEQKLKEVELKINKIKIENGKIIKEKFKEK